MFAYLATPYSKYPYGLDQAHIEACNAAGRLIEAGVPTFCPIAHSHAIAQCSGIDETDHDIWIAADQPFMDSAYVLVVAMLPSWEDSYGIGVEIEEFERTGRPVIYWEPCAHIPEELLEMAGKGGRHEQAKLG